MINICTSIEQSQKLIELGIDVNTADMMWDDWSLIDEGWKLNVGYYPEIEKAYGRKCYPAWSLSALLGLMPKLYDEDFINDGGCQPDLCKGFDNNMWHVVYRSTMYCTDWYCDPIDAAFDMVCWLLENKKI